MIYCVEDDASIRDLMIYTLTAAGFEAAGCADGAALAAAIRIAQRKENEGKTIVALLPDGGDRYLSTALYEE